MRHTAPSMRATSDAAVVDSSSATLPRWAVGRQRRGCRYSGSRGRHDHKLRARRAGATLFQRGDRRAQHRRLGSDRTLRQRPAHCVQLGVQSAPGTADTAGKRPVLSRLAAVRCALRWVAWIMITFESTRMLAGMTAHRWSSLPPNGCTPKRRPRGCTSRRRCRRSVSLKHHPCRWGSSSCRSPVAAMSPASGPHRCRFRGECARDGKSAGTQVVIGRSLSCRKQTKNSFEISPQLAGITTSVDALPMWSR